MPWNHEFSPSRRGFANAADARRRTCRSSSAVSLARCGTS
ncbi:hypothetical protein COLINT_02854 [Collinsella intestinalis DSM 13280]|uniref:Uncharacterized protein n=1 Tax=Collinsella intestinalis DSM 13280 TaxID=521003 RepID=C4F9W9_9ACTN|nr:hypothetical protein COLINT_02854 [Collinsella intestinalis DSM 13280]